MTIKHRLLFLKSQLKHLFIKQIESIETSKIIKPSKGAAYLSERKEALTKELADLFFHGDEESQKRKVALKERLNELDLAIEALYGKKPIAQT